MAECTKVEGNVVTIQVGFGFHRDKLMDVKTKTKLEAMYSELLDAKIEISVEVNEEAQQKQDDNELTDLTAAFGGQVVG